MKRPEARDRETIRERGVAWARPGAGRRRGAGPLDPETHENITTLVGIPAGHGADRVIKPSRASRVPGRLAAARALRGVPGASPGRGKA